MRVEEWGGKRCRGGSERVGRRGRGGSERGGRRRGERSEGEVAYDGVEMGGRGEEGEMKYEQGEVVLHLVILFSCTRVWSTIFWSVSRLFLTVLV